MDLRWHPRVKPEHGLFRAPDGSIRIGGAVYGIAAEVADLTGAVWTMLVAADGTRDVQEIVDTVRCEHPDENDAAIRSALNTFAEAGYLEDATAPEPDEMTERERVRYDRSMRFFRWVDLKAPTTVWEPQLKLKRSNVLLIGLGGTGGFAGLSLAATGVGHLYCADSDEVELSNLNRQVIYGEADIGRQKVEAAVERLRSLNSDISVEGERTTITGDADVRRLVVGRDLVVLCADRPGEIRAWVNRVCLETGTPWVDAGYHGPQVTAAAYLPGRGPCYECNWMAEIEFHRRANPSRPYSAQRASVDAVTAVSAGLSGCLAAHLAIAVLTDLGTVEPGAIQGINLMTAEHHVLIRNERHPECPACGEPPC
jgi:molybdopterin/thiamine biosynthesis adenylyltransferase